MTNKKNISAIYPLSPMQQGMLFHSLYAPESGVYLEQMSMNLTGNINVAAFEAAWQKVVDRYSIFRTFFVWENRENPLQVVLKQVLIPWHNFDWRELSTIEQEQQLKQLLLSQRKKGFDFKQAPLMNCTIIRLGDENYKFIWNHHHILMDGWCLSIIFKEVLSFYEAQLQGVNCQLPKSRPYSDYIDWLNSQNKSTAIEFWQQYLQGFTVPTPLVVDKTRYTSQHHSEDYDQIACVCSTDCSQKLATIAQEHHCTLSTIVQAAWALLLSRYSDESDVVFGVTVSGRPPDLPGVENIVGLFINTLPLRVKVPKSSNLISWLQEIQQSMVELQQYSYTPLVDIQAICELGGGISLFESIVVFENYPVDSSLLNEECSLLVSNIDDFERTNYPLTITVVSGSQLSLSISYDTTRFDQDTIERMAAHLNNLLEAIAQNPVANVDTFNLLCESERHQLLVEWNDTATKYPKDK
ncbi:condensation domain-containing protein, partial [Calothrix rhizosoleniae]|uniref:condensation domain-containing protein n=1 Tax=Calothrix rhizosoleniae TaxID=888997 RepID=UPI001F158534